MVHGSVLRGNTSVLIRIAKEREEDAGDDASSHDENGDTGGNRRVDGGGGGDVEVEGNRRGRVRVQHVQIDTGKTWREGVIRWFPRYVRG